MVGKTRDFLRFSQFLCYVNNKEAAMFTRIGFRMIKPCFGVLNKRMFESKSFGSHKLKKRVNKSTLYVPRMVIKDSRSLAEAMVRMIDDSEIDNHRQILISIRENEDMKKSLYERLLLEQQDSFRLKKAFPWFNEWLLKALSTDRVHLFPLFVPVVANDQLLDAKATLAAYLFAYKHRYPSRFFEYLLTTQPNEDYVEPQKDESTIYAKASIIANDIGDRLHISKIEKLTNLVKNYTEQTSQNQNLKAEQLLADITSLCSIHIDLLYPLLNFLDVAINPTLQTLIDSRSLRRQHITHDLSRELNSIVYNHYHGFSSNTNADEKTSSSDPLQAYYYLIDKNNNRRQIFRSELHDVKDKNIDASIRKENVSFSEQTVQNRDFQQKSFPISFVTVHFLETKVFCSQKFPLSESADALSVETSQRSYMGSSSEWNGEANLRKTADNDDYEQFLKSIQEEEFTNIFDSPPPNNPPPTTTGFQGALVSTATIPPPPSVFRPTSNSSIPIISEDYSAPYRKVLLDNLPNDITEFDLMNALQPCGKVKKIFLYNASTSSTPPEGTTLPKRRRSVVTTTKELAYPIESAETNLNSDIDLLEAEDISMDDVLEYVDSDIIENDTEKPKNIMDEDDDTFVGEDEDEEDTDEDEDFVSSTTDSPQNEESTQKKKKQNRAAGLRKVKKKMAQGDRTDRYAFVVFESDESYFRATRDIFRLFGLILKGQQCRIYQAESYRNFRVEMKDSVNIKDALQAIKVALDGKFDCNLLRPIVDRSRPLFINLQFQNHENAWMAFQALQKLQQDGLILFEPSWIRSNHYWNMAKRMKIAFLNSQQQDEESAKEEDLDLKVQQVEKTHEPNESSSIKSFYDTTARTAHKKKFSPKYYR